MVWTTKVLRALGVTRDSLALFWAKWVALILALAPMGTDVTRLGIPASWVPYIQLAALCIAVTSAQHRTSDLPGDRRAAQVTKPILDAIPYPASAGSHHGAGEAERHPSTAIASMNAFAITEDGRGKSLSIKPVNKP